MQVFKFKKLIALHLILALIFVIGVTFSTAQQKIKVAGKMSLTQSGVNTIEIGDVEGHAISLGKAEGTNTNIGENKFMDGAQLVNMYFSDTIMGNGHHHGYVKFIQAADTVFAKWEGKVTTTLSEDKTPITSYEGTFTFTKGTGQFKDIQGKGTYKGKFISEAEFVSEWEGEYFIKE